MDAPGGSNGAWRTPEHWHRRCIAGFADVR